MLIKIYDLDATGLKMINLVKSPFFGQHRIITCCLLSESFQNQSQCFWVDSAPRDMLPLIPWYCGRSALHWEASFLAECLAGRLQRQEHSEQPAPAVPYRVSEGWEHLLGAKCTTALEKPSVVL